MGGSRITKVTKGRLVLSDRPAGVQATFRPDESQQGATEDFTDAALAVMMANRDLLRLPHLATGDPLPPYRACKTTTRIRIAAHAVQTPGFSGCQGPCEKGHDLQSSADVRHMGCTCLGILAVCDVPNRLVILSIIRTALSVTGM